MHVITPITLSWLHSKSIISPSHHPMKDKPKESIIKALKTKENEKTKITEK
jgi:hypothetical protein